MSNGSITLICGPSGSGKSTYLKTRPNKVIICPDDFRIVMTGQYHYPPAEDMIWTVVKTVVRVLVGQQNENVIVDATSLTVFSRKQWIQIANELNVTIHCVYIHTSKATCKLRNSLRDRKVPEEVIDKQFASFVLPTRDEGFCSVEKVDTE